MYTANHANVTFTSSSFESCTSSAYGGGIWAQDAIVNMKSTTMTSCISTYVGPLFPCSDYLRRNRPRKPRKCLTALACGPWCRACFSSQVGGGIWAEGTTKLKLESSVFSSCSAGGVGS